MLTQRKPAPRRQITTTSFPSPKTHWTWDNKFMKWVRAAITVAAAVGCSGVIAAGPATADPDRAELIPAPAIGPGVAMITYGADTKPGASCTAGWLVHGADGQRGLLTAGHCDHGGGAVYRNSYNGFEGIGRFIRALNEGDKGDDADIAELGIGNYPGAPNVVTDTRIIGIRPVQAPVDDTRLANGQILCHYGATTGPPNRGPECGAITYISSSTVVFDAKVAQGDSGGPVYYRNADGTATPVGITIRGDDTGVVAELIGPWLRRWQLSVDTTPAPAGQTPVGFRPR